MTKFIIIGLVVCIVILMILLIKNRTDNKTLDKKNASIHGRDLKKYRDSDSARELANRRWNKK